MTGIKSACLLLTFVCLWPSVNASSKCITQADFAEGSFIIDAPGNYKLCEDILFDPQGPAAGEVPDENVYDPNFEYGYYDKNAFGLGFFAAIVVKASDVTIKLNGYTIEQSPGHALMQRFFAVIELFSAPFISGAGPAEFVGSNTYEMVSNVTIKGPGIIGRSSHHGIHGNENNNVVIKDIDFKDFEVAAISMNNVDSLIIKRCNILHNRHDVPVVGLFSAARFIRPYGKYLKDMGYKMYLRGQETSAASTYDALVQSIDNVYEDVINGKGFIDQSTHPEEFELFNNPFRAVDGPCYGFLVHGKGPAVGGFGEVFNETDDSVTSSNVVIKDNTIKNMKCWVNEVPALVEDGVVMNDARGAVFQTISSVDKSLISINTDGTYKGNVVADMQIMVANAISEGIITDLPEHQTGVNSIGEALIVWAKNGAMTYSPSYRCNGDSMHHVSKGISVIRVEDTAGFRIKGNDISNIENLSVPPFGDCTEYHEGASVENLGERPGGNIRGISIAAVRGYVDRRSTIKQNTVKNLASVHANVIIGVDIQGDSAYVAVKGNVIDLQSGIGEDPDDPFIACRVRQFVDNTVIIGRNDLQQEEEINNARRLSIESLRGHPGGEIEWRTGGCPFAHRHEF